MDAPSSSLMSEPFMEGAPLDFDQPMMDEFFMGWSDDFWGGEEVAPSEQTVKNVLHELSAAPVSPTQIQLCHQYLSGAETVPMNGPFLVPCTDLELKSIGSFPSTLSGGYRDHLTTVSPSDANNFVQSSPLSHSTLDVMQYSVKIPDAQQLATFSGIQLDNLAKAVAQAQELAKERKLKESAKSPKHRLHNEAPEKKEKGKHGSQHNQSLLVCLYSDCGTTFRRKKDRTRHVRVKHQETPGFACPVINRTMGTGHIFQRSDKLRDHLRGKAVSAMTWRCVLTGCSETGVYKTWWFDHIKKHDQETRRANSKLLFIYGYKDFYGGYMMLEHLCTITGCPFGTTSATDCDEHILIPHNGPHCSCPIPDCNSSFKDWNSLRDHLAADHLMRELEAAAGVLRSQGFIYWRDNFRCPVLYCRQVVGGFGVSAQL